MRAVVITKPGGPDVLTLQEVPFPLPHYGEVRVRVGATAINRADILQRMGLYPAPADAPANIPGIEFAGEVDAIADGVTGFKIGDRVFGLVGGGAYAEFLTAPAKTLVHMPSGMSFLDAVAIPEAFLTAYDALLSQAGLAPGETLLVNAAASAVGLAALQIARAIGASSIGTSRTEAKLDICCKQGMDHGIASPDGRFAEQVNALTAGRGVDVVLELVGGHYLNEDLSCMAEKSRLLLIGLVGGATATLDLASVLRKRILIKGSVLRARPLEEKIALANVLAKNIVPLVEREVLRPVVERVMPLEQAASAQAYVASNAGFGKVVLNV